MECFEGVSYKRNDVGYDGILVIFTIIIIIITMQSSESSRSSGTPETQVLASEGRQSPQVFPCGSRARVFIINAHRTMDRCGSGHECAKPLGAGCLRGRLGQVLA